MFGLCTSRRRGQDNWGESCSVHAAAAEMGELEGGREGGRDWE